MTTLHLGVFEVPYASAEEPQRVAKPGKGRRRGKAQSSGGNQTTGDVAEILENKYHVMETFYELHQEEVADHLADAMAGALENLFAGAPVTTDPLGSGTSQINERFKTFLESKEMDSLGIPGVPTEASLRGVNHRLKRNRGAPRPSFIDTGLYEANFTSWVD